MSWRGRAVVAAALALGIGSACRELSVCAGDVECAEHAGAAAAGGGAAPAAGAAPADEPASVERGGQSSTDGEPTAGAETSPAGEGGRAPDDGEAGGQAGQQGGEPPAVCKPGWAECDGSSFTVCETHISQDIRHCGACQQRCEDAACVNGECRAVQKLMNGPIRGFVASDSVAFVFSKSPFADTVVRIDLQTAAVKVIDEFGASGPAFAEQFQEVVLGPDRLYAPYIDTAMYQMGWMSMKLDGSDLRTENIFAPRLAATTSGLYYVALNPATDNSAVWFRPRGASESEVLFEAYATVFSNTTTDVLLGWETGAGLELGLLRERTVRSIGVTAAWPADAELPTADAAAFIAYDPQGIARDLWWYEFGKEATQQQLPPNQTNNGNLLARGSGCVASLFRERGAAYVQRFDARGPLAPAVGVPTTARMLLADSEYVWYAWLSPAAGETILGRVRWSPGAGTGGAP